MPLPPGTKLGPYEIQGPLGAGGMGEVYRARDTRLERSVAIKILPAQFSADPVRKQRFEREAKTISGLNHPNICVLHDIGSQDGVDYLVMECVEGETLAKRLEKGPLPLEQVLRYGAQIAVALDCAHRSGVVHRDLKPGNIMLPASGVKLMDFGLAKPAAPLAGGLTLSAAATQTTPVTAEGTIVGTVQYMSPEQVEAKEVDGRSDIFSLGAVLYEMLTGQKAFQGKSQLSVASAILEKEPSPISSLNPMTSATLDHAIRRCLAKDPEDRWQSARDLALELDWGAESSSPSNRSARSPFQRSSREWVAWVLASIALLAAIAIGISRYRQPMAFVNVTRYTISPPDQGKFLFGGYQEGPKVSPDGRRIAFIANVSGVEQIWTKAADSLLLQPIAGTERAMAVFWSPDSENIGFVANGRVERVSIFGGPPRTVCELDGSPRGGSWNRQDIILFGTTPGSVYKVSAAGGVPQRVTTLDAGRQDIVHRWPFFLPDGNHFLYLASSTVTAHERGVLLVGSLNGNPDKLLMHVSSPAAYANGYLVYLSGQDLMARPFDPDKLEFTGNALTLADGVLLDPYFGAAAFSVSENGVLVYQQGKPFTGYSLQVLDRSGRRVTGLDEPAVYFWPRISPAGKQVAYHSPDLQTGKTDIFTWDLASGNRVRLTFSSHYYRTAVWSPDGKRLAYLGLARQSGTAAIFIKPIGSVTPEQKLLDLSTGAASNLTQWSPDGQNLIADDLSTDLRRLRIISAPVDGLGVPKTVLENPEASVGSGQVSPDGHWLAYRSVETGRGEVYVTSFPTPSGKIQVSAGGAGSPRWRKDGKELFFVGWDGNIMAAELKDSEGSLEVASVQRLFHVTGLLAPRTAHYDVTPDGSHFAILVVGGDETAAPLNLVVNWPVALKQK